MLRIILAVSMLAGASPVWADEKAIALEDFDKFYQSEGVKQRTLEVEENRKGIADYKALIAKLKAVGVEDRALRSINEQLERLEGQASYLQGREVVPPRLDPLKLTAGQAGLPHGNRKSDPTAIRFLKVIGDGEKGALVSFDGTLGVAWLEMDLRGAEIRPAEIMSGSTKIAVLGARVLEGQSYPCIRLYATPEERKKPN